MSICILPVSAGKVAYLNLAALLIIWPPGVYQQEST